MAMKLFFLCEGPENRERRSSIPAQAHRRGNCADEGE